MSHLLNFPYLATAQAERPDLFGTDDDGKPILTDGMEVTAYAVMPEPPEYGEDGEPLPDTGTEGQTAPGVWILLSSVVADLDGEPLQLPEGVVYITPVYAGMVPPVAG